MDVPYELLLPGAVHDRVTLVDVVVVAADKSMTSDGGVRSIFSTHVLIAV